MGRMSQERMEKAQKQLMSISKKDYEKVKAMANIGKPLRSVLHRTPDDHGMTGWRDIYFPSDDGIPLEGWYIPARGGESDKLVIFNHALPMCRAGFPGHLGEPWSMFDAVEIDFVIQMRHLTDAGYNVLALRHPQPRKQRRRQRRPLRHRTVGVARLRGRQEVRGQSACAQQDDGRALQPVHGWKLAIRSHLPAAGPV
jgi:hypothetical protein